MLSDLSGIYILFIFATVCSSSYRHSLLVAVHAT
ncbi:MAG: hypothetical protein ACI9G5_002653 [Paracoccaceae bacterium]|jgi:hypothetical protein